jgi:hypothetical protein
MTTSPVVTITDELIAELESLAIEVKGWNMPVAFQEPEEGFLPDDWEWHVGRIDEEDNRYPLLHVNAHQYDSDDSERLARYYAACNRDTILALLAERAELKRDAERYRWLRENVKTEFYGDQLADMFTCTGAKIDKLVDAAMQAAK